MVGWGEGGDSVEMLKAVGWGEGGVRVRSGEILEGRGSGRGECRDRGRGKCGVRERYGEGKDGTRVEARLGRGLLRGY